MNPEQKILTSANAETLPSVAVVMGSDSDLETLKPGIEVLSRFGIGTEVRILSAHRTPMEMVAFANNAKAKGLKVIIAGAGGAAHLPGMIASLTSIPVIGVPVKTKSLSGIDSMYSILQMPSGIPVATVAIGGGLNAGLLAAQILASADSEIESKIDAYRHSLNKEVISKDKKLVEIGTKEYLNQMKGSKVN
tara:strand:+ start:1329 stop:1904 length:576 start_codon:yes stop_codon:yes gene_type:complete